MKESYFIIVVSVLLFSCERASDTDDIVFKFYGDESKNIGYSISKTENGFFISGQYTELTRENTPGGPIVLDSKEKMVVLRTDTEGNVVGTVQILGQALISAGKKIITLDDGTAVSTGFVTDSITSETDIYVVKLDADGNMTSEQIFKSAGNQYGTDIIKTPEGFLVLGTTDVKREPVSSATGNAEGKKDILLLRLNNNLESVSTIPAVGFIGNDEGVTIKPDINGGYIVVGTTDRSDRSSSDWVPRRS